VNTDLIKELKHERSKPQERRDDPVQDDIIRNLEENEEKIVQHGRRADAIVKGMLQHSRIGSGQKDPTDINSLADEYLRLSYHGMRAKDKTFNARFETNFDESIGKINVIPQDIGRLLLNLYNNAFYAVMEQEKNARRFENLRGLQQPYVPTVTVVTKNLNGAIEIRVRDNGPGIPKNIVQKIFQPFFTTKPAGEGTGLGLSLSYDIVRAHGGEIKVETNADKGTEFIIRLPA
jgi:signal transduction histidine kinase